MRDYVFSGTIPHPRTNSHPKAQTLDDVHFLKALHRCFNGADDELNFVDFDIEYKDADIVRKTRIGRGAEERQSSATAIRRT